MLLAAAALTLAVIDLNRKKRSGALCIVCVMLGAHQVTHTHKTAHPPEGSNWDARTKNLSLTHTKAKHMETPPTMSHFGGPKERPYLKAKYRFLNL